MATVVPTLTEIFEEAFERAGTIMQGGYDLKTVRRSLQILMLEWQNRGLNLWTIEAGTKLLVSGTASYTLDVDTIDLIEHQLRTGAGENQTDYNLERVSVSTYAQQTNKNTTGRPTQIFIQRLADSTTATVWPVPDSGDYTLAYYRLAGMNSLSTGITGTADVPPRFVPALVAGLAFNIAMKKPKLQVLAPALKREYEIQFNLAAGEDRERASLRLVPARCY